MNASESPTVTGTFEDKKDVERALSALTRRDIREEAIDLVVIDREGLHPRHVSGSAIQGWRRGLWVGLIAGALLGALAGAAVMFGVPLVPVRAAAVLPGSIVGTTLFGLLAGAIVGAPVGALVSLARKGRSVPLSKEEADQKVIVVSVRGEDVAGTARDVLAEAGATRISG
jgi:hypothetical protein